MNRTRDEKGRFIKGNDEGKKFKAGGEQSEIARMGGKAVQEAKRQRRTIADALRKVLDEPMGESGLTRLDGVVQSTLQDFYKKPNVKGLKIIAEILGELEQNVNVKTDIVDKPVINIISKGGK